MLPMLAVGVKELKAKLSEYLRSARAGETVLVTDRGRVVAELGPPSGRAREAASSGIDALLADLEARGEATPARLPKAGWRWEPKGVTLPPESAARILDELRADTSRR